MPARQICSAVDAEICSVLIPGRTSATLHKIFKKYFSCANIDRIVAELKGKNRAMQSDIKVKQLSHSLAIDTVSAHTFCIIGQKLAFFFKVPAATLAEQNFDG